MRSRGIEIDGVMLRKHRQENGLTQERLSQLADCDTRTIRNAEKGQKVDLTTIENIAGAIQVPVGWLTQPDRLPETTGHIAAQRKAAIQGQLNGLVRKDAGPILWPIASHASISAPGFCPPLHVLHQKSRNTKPHQAYQRFLTELFSRFDFLQLRNLSFYGCDDVFITRASLLVATKENVERFELHFSIESEFQRELIMSQVYLGNFHELQHRWNREPTGKKPET